MIYINPGMADPAIHAVRLGQYKAHFVTQGAVFNTDEDPACTAARERPLLYHCILLSTVQGRSQLAAPVQPGPRSQ